MVKPVKQSGILNFTKSDMLNVPRNLRTQSYAPETKLAYITPEEEGILAALKPGTPHEGPEGIPNYDSFGTIVDDKDVGVGGGDVRDTGGGGGGQGNGSAQEEQRNRAAQKKYYDELMAEHAAEDSAADKKKQRELAALNKRHREELEKERAGAALPTIAEEREASGQVDKVKKAVREAELKRSGAARFYPEFEKDYEYKSYDPLKLGEKLQNLSMRISDYGGFPFDINFPSLMAMPMEMLKSFGLDKEEIMKKIMNKEKLSRNEEQAIAGLLAAQKANANVLPTSHKDAFRWGFPGYKNLIMGSDEDFQGWKGFKLDEDYEKMIDEYYEGKPGGLGDLFGLLEGRKEGEGKTKEELLDELSSGEEHYLKTNRPDLYYKLMGTPQTQGGLEDLAQLSMSGLTNSPEDRRLSYEIQQARDAVFEASDRADQMSGRATTGGGQEVASMPTYSDVNNNGILDYLETAGTGTTETSAGNQLAFASPGQIGYMTPEGYQWGTTGEYSPYAEVNLQNIRNGGIVGLYNGGYLNNSNGVIGLDGGGYLDDYRAADSLMFKDPQEDEEWEYNV